MGRKMGAESYRKRHNGRGCLCCDYPLKSMMPERDGFDVRSVASRGAASLTLDDASRLLLPFVGPQD